MPLQPQKNVKSERVSTDLVAVAVRLVTRVLVRVAAVLI